MLDRKVILFDLGGVLVGSAGRIAVRALLPSMSEHHVLERRLRSRAVNLFERGQIPPGTFAGVRASAVDLGFKVDVSMHR